MEPEVDAADDLEDDTEDVCVHIKDQVEENFIIAVLAADDIQPYYVLKTSGPVETLAHDSTDDFGASFRMGDEVISGLYFDCTKSNKLKYRLIPKKRAIVPALSVKYIFTDVAGLDVKP